jgi:hypothetical protein
MSIVLRSDPHGGPIPVPGLKAAFIARLGGR